MFAIAQRPLNAARAGLALLLAALALPAAAQLDICGCSGLPNSLGAFNAGDSATYPPGTINQSQLIRIPLPASGILVFDSFTGFPRHTDASKGTFEDFGGLTIDFVRNAANTPVTILIKGDFNISSGATLSVRGNSGSAGSAGLNGVGGLGGPGGFRGGDGAYQIVNFASIGGAGLGPAGGAGGSGGSNGGPGGFVGVPELLPLAGGCGGGGGSSQNNSTGSSGGGGGGGGGAILIAANGTITVNGSILADGGDGGGRSGASTFGSAGAGGAIRLAANAIVGGGSLFARSGSTPNIGLNAAAGRVRMESFINSMSASNTDPVASRAPAPGPITNPFTPTVKIISVGGQAPPADPQGGYGVVDVVLPAPGATPIVVESSGVPVGTVIRLTVKARVGGTVITHDITLGGTDSSCTGAGVCTSSPVIDLPAGAFTVEAQATLQTPAP